ncbi:MAG TPA: hypothetical protein VHE59_01665 [Mucilaginibacter sp.]|nr:hypothetical protein [Mucilaginibacter sp.]
MKKILLWNLLLLFPCLLFAQNDQTLIKDFEKKVQGIGNTIQLSDHVNIAQIQVDDDNFELLAIDDKMQVLWRISLAGQGASSGIFKGNILATASVPGKSKKDPIDYMAYLVDAQTGKLLVQKQVFHSTTENYEVPETLFAKDGSWARFVIRQTADTKKGMYVKIDKYDATQQLTVFDLNDKLESVTTQCNLPAGVYRNIVSGSADNFIVIMFEPAKAFEALKFTDGKPDAVATITQSLNLPEKLHEPELSTACISAASDPDVVYLSSYYRDSNKDYKLTLCKFDFKNNSSKSVSETNDGDHLKELKKTVDESYRKLGFLTFGKLFDFEVNHMAEYGGVITIAIGDSWALNNYQNEGSVIIAGYDEDMNQKFEQVVPIWTTGGPTSNTAMGYYFHDNKLCITANTGNTRFATIYAELDLNAGKWIRYKRLEKAKIDGSDFITNHNLWYKNNFALIYVPFTHFLHGKVDLSLQQNAY